MRLRLTVPGLLAPVVAAAVLAAPATAAPRDTALSTIASGIVRSTVRLECRPQSDFPGRAAGTAFHGRALIWLLDDWCAMLHRFAGSPRAAVWASLPDIPLDTATTLANAATGLAHESFHLRGIHDEATTDCYAVQTAWRVLVRLGASERWARSFARYWIPMVHGLPAVAPCRDGGPLDLDRRPGWPNHA